MISYCEVGAVPLEVGVCFGESDFRREMKRLNDKENTPFLIGGSIGTMHTFGRVAKPDICIICVDALKISKDHSRTRVMGIIVHECVHVLQSLNAAMGAQDEAREWEAYFVEYIFEFCVSEYEKFMKGRRK